MYDLEFGPMRTISGNPCKERGLHLRHTNAKTTLEHYIKSVPASVRIAVEALDHLLKSKGLTGSTN